MGRDEHEQRKKGRKEGEKALSVCISALEERKRKEREKKNGWLWIFSFSFDSCLKRKTELMMISITI